MRITDPAPNLADRRPTASPTCFDGCSFGRMKYIWRLDGIEHALELVSVEGTNGQPFLFGEEGATRPIDVPSFLIATTPVTQALWAHVTGSLGDQSTPDDDRYPAINVSWNDLTQDGGFLDRINGSRIRSEVAEQVPSGADMAFRLPSETEWEYAARGGREWRDGFAFSGGADIETVAWYQGNSGDRRHEVRQKAPNQLGAYDMSGNVWEWCQDSFTPDFEHIPVDGSAFGGPGNERVLRGGCFHNWAIHCTVSKRYEIGRTYADPCIGCRLVFAPANR
jgi:sulfatase modifying factor 1